MYNTCKEACFMVVMVEICCGPHKQVLVHLALKWSKRVNTSICYIMLQILLLLGVEWLLEVTERVHFNRTNQSICQ